MIQLLLSLCFLCFVLIGQTISGGVSKGIRETDVLPILNGIRRLQQSADMQILNYNALLAEDARTWASKCKFSTSEAPNQGQAISVNQSPQTYKQRLCDWIRNGQMAFDHYGSTNDDAGCNRDSHCRNFKRIMSASATSVGCGTAQCDQIEGYSIAGQVFVCNFAIVADINLPPFTKGTPCSRCVRGQRCVNGLCLSGNSTASIGSASSLDQLCSPDPTDANEADPEPVSTPEAEKATGNQEAPELGDECAAPNLRAFCTFVTEKGYCEDPKYSDALWRTCPKTCNRTCPDNTYQAVPPEARCLDFNEKVCAYWKMFRGCGIKGWSEKLCPSTCDYQGNCDKSGVYDLFNSLGDQGKARELGMQECAEDRHRTACQMLRKAGSCSVDVFKQPLQLVCPLTCGGTGCPETPANYGSKRKHVLAALGGAAAVGVVGGLFKKFMGHGHQNQNANQPMPQGSHPNVPSHFALQQPYSNPQQHMGAYGNIRGPYQPVLQSSQPYGYASPFMKPLVPANPSYTQPWDCQKSVSAGLCYSPDVCYRCRTECKRQNRNNCGN